MTETCVSFVSQAAYDDGIAEKLDLKRQVIPVTRTRTINKRDLVRNGLTPKIEVDPETFAVKVDGVHATVAPVESVRLGQLYFFS